MHLSVMLFPFHGAISKGRCQPEELVKNLHAAGATGLEPMYGWNEKDPEKFIRKLEAEGITLDKTPAAATTTNAPAAAMNHGKDK